MEKTVKQYLAILQEDPLEASIYYMEKIGTNVTLMSEFAHELKNALKIKGRKEYVYMITFTIDPAKIPDVSKMKNKIQDYIISQSERKALNLIRYEIVEEEHKDGRPHWHALAVSTKYLSKDRFNFYIKNFGNIDLSKSYSQQPQEIINYMSKSGLIKKII